MSSTSLSGRQAGPDVSQWNPATGLPYEPGDPNNQVGGPSLDPNSLGGSAVPPSTSFVGGAIPLSGSFNPNSLGGHTLQSKVISLYVSTWTPATGMPWGMAGEEISAGSTQAVMVPFVNKTLVEP